MDILVMLEERDARAPVLAHVNSVPARSDSEHPSRNVVTLYGDPDMEGLTLALAAAVESHRDGAEPRGAVRHLGVWLDRGAVGDSAWRDSTGALVSRDLDIPLDRLRKTAEELLRDCGAVIHRLWAGLRMPDWPEGARRAISVSLDPAFVAPALAAGALEAMLDAVREGDGDWWAATSEAY